MYIERNGQFERVWKLRVNVNGFDTFVFCRGTENEMRAYMDDEFPRGFSYHAITDAEYNMVVSALKMTVYIAPKL